MKKRFTLLALLIIIGWSGVLTGQIPTSGLIAYWPFNGNANDESGNGHNAVENTATLSTDRFGNDNSAYDFDGALGSYIMVPDHDDLDPLNDFTFTFWFNLESYASIGGQVLNKYRAGVNSEGAWAAQLNPRCLGISAAGGFFSSTVVPLNTWSFGTIVFTKSSNSWSIYLNGQLDASGISPVVIMNTTRNLYIGKHEGATYGKFNGKIDDIRMYNLPLNEQEIHVLYNEGNGSTISTQNQTVMLGKSFEVKVNTSELTSTDNVSAYQFDFNYDNTKLEYEGSTLIGTLSDGGSLQINPMTGILSIAWAREIPLIGTSTIIKLYFKCIAIGATTPTITNALFNTSEVTATNGTITSFCKYGDIDANDKVQAYDASLAIQYSVGLDPIPTIDALPWESWRVVSADVDGAAGVTANDASEILKYTVGLINSFPVEGAKKALKNATTADVNVSVENGEIVFRSNGELFGLNVFVKENKEYLGHPSILEASMLKATNISATIYAIGLASAYSPENGVTFMKIPFTTAKNIDVTFDMIINTTPKQVTIGLTTGIITVKDKTITVYPNPANNILYVKGLKQATNVTIYDLSGKAVIKQQVKNDQIDVNGLKNGMYSLRIEDKSGVITHKFVKR